MTREERYHTLNMFYRQRFGCRVHKITVDAGFTCPNRDGSAGIGGCIYCNTKGSGTGASSKATITEQLKSVQAFLRKRYQANKFIAYFQAFSNTYAPVETLERLYNEALDVKDIVGLSIGTRPDCAGEVVLDLLEDLNGRAYINVEYGLQSSHDRTLSIINRGHDFRTFADAVGRTRKRGIDITTHVILGLPGETKDDMLATARTIADMDIQGLKLHLLYVVRGTKLHEMYERGEYHCLTREDYIDIVCDFLALLPPSMIIHRLTGDPHPDELVAPEWSLDKFGTRDLIHDELRMRSLTQGCRYKNNNV